ncbi:MAG: CAP domain-containing protein [Candidatus Dormibacteraeota bacterium]|nr:CAP domain-containing protein [Candidatus Dormibacteraeota bacterium]
MSRSVIKVAIFTVGVPLVILVSVTALGAPQGHVGHARLQAANSAFLHLRHSGLNDLGRLVDDLPAPTPVPVPAAVPAAPLAQAPAAAAPARPAPVYHPAPPPAPPPVVGVGGAAGVQLSLVNSDRAANGVAALSYSGTLARVAQYRAQDMLNRNYFSHYDPATGQLAFVQLFHLWGIGYSSAGENIAWSTNPSMAQINIMFMNSPEHRDNILNGAYHRVGIGVASNGARTMVVEVFSN